MIKLYSTHCPQCKALEMKLNKAKIKYEVHDDIEEMKQLNFASAPMLDIGDKILNFSEAVKWVNAQ